jgi:hypothetical protein
MIYGMKFDQKGKEGRDGRVFAVEGIGGEK